MNKQIKHTYGGMTKDISKSRFPNTSYYDASAFRVTASEGQSTYSLANEKGTKVQITFPNYTVSPTQIHIVEGTHIRITPHNAPDIPIGVHTDHKLVGSITVKDGIVFFTTGTIDTIWLYKFDNENYIELLYARDLGFSQDYQITGISNYENEKIEKIYWVDSVNQLRHLNIRHSKLNGDYENIIDIPTDNIDMVGKIKINQPIIKEITTGGNHTAGVIQYAYNLYRLNGGQSQTSPLSEQVALGNGAMGGAGVNQPANTAPIIRIEDIDSNYTNIKVYALKYTSYGVLPEVNIIYDQTIPESRNVEIFDDGLNIGSITIEEFLFLSTNIIIPEHITSKDNYMFYSNYKEKNFKVDLDVRAYSFNTVDPATAVSRVYSDVESLDNLNNTPVRLITPGNFPDNPNDTFDNINLDYDTYRYSMNSYVWDDTFLIPATGGTGKYLTYEIIPTKTFNSRNKYFKDQEVYRIGVQFYNAYGKTTNPMWIADFKAPVGNMIGAYNTLNFTWKPAFYTWLNSQTFDEYDRPVGYKILIAERGADDRTIITSGIVSTMMVNVKGDGSGYNTDSKRENKSEDLPKLPNFLIRNINFENINSNTRPLYSTNHLEMMSRSRSVDSEVINGKSGGKSWQYNKMLQLFSPDTIFNQNISLPSGVKMRIKGLMRNTYNAVWAQEVNASNGILITDGKGEDGISIPFTKNTQMTEGQETSLHDTGIISHPGGSDPNVFSRDLFYRRYGLAAPEIENANGIDDEGYNILLGGSGYYYLIEKTPNNNTSTGSASLITKPDELLFNLRKSSFNPSDEVFVRAGIRLNINIQDSLPFDYKITYSLNDITEEIKGTATSSVTINIPLLETKLTDSDSNQTISIIPAIKRSTSGTINGSLHVTNNISLGNPNIIEFCNNASFTGNSMNVFDVTGTPILFNINNTSNPINNNPFDPQNYYQPYDKIYDIYGRPEFALRGQNYKSYNNDNKFRYSNTLQSFSSDNDVKKWKEGGIYGRRIVSIDSDANNNITFVPTINDIPVTIEDLYSNLPADSSTLKDAVPYVELIKSRNDIYLGGLYGGNSYEDKLRSKYVEIGKYNKIEEDTIVINSPGDTFVQNFKFLRIVRRDENAINQGTYHMEEIVEFPIETSIDLENRNDVSNQDWDGKIAYSNTEYHDYNRVYSQPNNLHQKTGNEYTVKEVDSYETNITASKLKTAGELIDNWLDLLPNEVINLDGKFGPITNLLFLNNEVYTLQDKAFSKLSINPRVQVQGNDGISIELGSGTVLQDYQYISTDIGCKNKHGSIVTPYGIYFYDSNNKRLNLYNGQITPLSETAGLHSYLYNKNLNNIDLDKPLKGTGLSLGYDYINNDVYFSFLTNNEDAFTLRYTEKGNLFIDANKYLVNHYAGFSDKFYGSLSDNKIHQFSRGDYNNYFGTIIPSTVTLIVNPEADLSVVVNNIMFKSEAYLDGVDQPNITLTHIRAYNEYQDSGQVPLVNNRRGNIQRLFREWNAQVPRVAGTRERIRNPWTYLELTFNNPNNYKFILHDMNISYSV